MSPNNSINGNAPGVNSFGTGATMSTNTPVKPENDVVFRDKPKKNTGMILGMVILAILAIGGIGFGVYMVLGGNQQVADLNGQIDTLKSQNSELMDKISELEKANSEAQKELADDEKIIEEDQEKIASDEEGYRVISIGDCVFDSGVSDGSKSVLKCDAKTSIGNGKFVWDSEGNILRFVTLSSE